MEIVILDSGYRSYDFEKEFFENQGFTLKIYPSYEGSQSDKLDFAKNADGILVRHTVIDDHFLSGTKRLKAVVRYGVGYDNIDLEACSGHNIRVANVQGYANQAVSDHALALIFSCSRAMWDTDSQLFKSFASPPVTDVFELFDKTLGIIGLGRIGSVLSRKASSLFKGVIATDPYKPHEHFDSLSVKNVSLDELFAKSDVISIHCNLTDETTHLLDESAFDKIQRRPVIVNTSRGSVIKEEALLSALNAGRIHSAGLDVYEDEPVTERQSALLRHPRVICTGHYAWYSDQSMKELQKRAATNLLDLLSGKPVEDALN